METYPTILKVQALNLRSQGLTYREIRQKLSRNIPKGTLSSWFKHTTLPEKYYQRMLKLGHNNIRLAQKHNQLQLSSRLNKLHLKNIPLIKEVNLSIGKIILAVLYWCEGNKYPGTRDLRFGNSDPGMIKLFLALLRQCYSLSEDKFRLTIQCRADQNLTSLTNFWTKVTAIPAKNHYQPRVDNRSIGKITQKTNYQGVCVIDYFDANLQCELQFLGEALGSDEYIKQVKNQIN